LVLRHHQIKYGFQIYPETQIGEGFYLGHWGTVVINPKTKIGKNCNIAQGVTIAQANRGKNEGVPEIGNEVWIGKCCDCRQYKNWKQCAYCSELIPQYRCS
jgi:serine O-acetyltransferase